MFQYTTGCFQHFGDFPLIACLNIMFCLKICQYIFTYFDTWQWHAQSCYIHLYYVLLVICSSLCVCLSFMIFLISVFVWDIFVCAFISSFLQAYIFYIYFQFVIYFILSKSSRHRQIHGSKGVMCSRSAHRGAEIFNKATCSYFLCQVFISKKSNYKFQCLFE